MMNHFETAFFVKLKFVQNCKAAIYEFGVLPLKSGIG